MSDVPQPGYWQAADGKWYPPQQSVGAPPGYGMPVPTPKTNGMAIVSLVLGIVGLVTCLGPVLGIPAIITGVMGKRQIKESNGTETGEGLATGGIITGWLGVGLLLIGLIAIVAITFLGSSASSKFSSVGSAIR